MVRALDSGARALGSSPGRGHWEILLAASCYENRGQAPAKASLTYIICGLR